MPIYEYECPKCGHIQEELILTENDIPKCVECGSNVKRIMSAGNFILKGKGWAKDGYGLKKTEKEKAST